MSECSCGKKKIRDYICKIISIEKLSERIFWLTVECPELASVVRPGNTVMIYPSSTSDPLLGRPFAVADRDIEKGFISVCWMILGRGTEMMTRFMEGATVQVRGVFGVPFSEDSTSVHLAGGGAGAGILFLFAKLFPERTASLSVGMPGRGYEKFAEKILSIVPNAKIYTDDGSFGDGDSMFKVLPKELNTNEQIWACGPPGFLNALEKHCASSLDKLYFAIDNRMACGYGGCMGCVINTKNGMKRICVDQSLFRADEVIRDAH